MFQLKDHLLDQNGCFDCARTGWLFTVRGQRSKATLQCRWQGGRDAVEFTCHDPDMAIFLSIQKRRLDSLPFGKGTAALTDLQDQLWAACDQGGKRGDTFVAYGCVWRLASTGHEVR